MTDDIKTDHRKPKRIKRVSVKPLRVAGENGRLVEWRTASGQLARSVVALDSIDGERRVDINALKEGEVGEDWAARDLLITPEGLQVALRNRGIWTAEDARADMNAVRAAFNAALRDDLEAFNKFIRSK